VLRAEMIRIQQIVWEMPLSRLLPKRSKNVRNYNTGQFKRKCVNAGA